MLIDLNNYELLEKAVQKTEGKISRTEAKAAHAKKPLPEGGVWRTIRGHHIYIKDGKVLAGSLPKASGTGAKKATKAHLQKYQEHIDKEAEKAVPEEKPKTKKPTTKEKPKKKATPKKKAKSESKKKQTPVKKPKTSVSTKKKDATAPKHIELTVSGKPKTPKKKTTQPKAKKETKNIRSDVQQNREVAYDTGEKIGGARKDMAVARDAFIEKSDAHNLEQLEQISPEAAERFCIKKNILKPIDFDQEHKNGVDVNAALAKKLIYDRISPKPLDNTPEARQKYLSAITEIQRILTPIKSFSTLREAINDLEPRMRLETPEHLKDQKSALNYQTTQLKKYKELAKQIKNGTAPAHQPELRMPNPLGFAQGRVEMYQKFVKEYKDRIKQWEQNSKKPFHVLGDKFTNFFTNFDSRRRTFDTIREKKYTWDQFLTEKAKPKEKGKRGEGVKKWERKLLATTDRTGGKKTPVKKPEDAIKTFGFRGVEFGNWVEDKSGAYHLIKSAEAFHDLADILGLKDKDVSFKGKLGMAFGARGKGGALAHYEPDLKVINMTKMGGAGSLAHEWGHALDNIMYQYSHGGKRSTSLASESAMGDNADPKVKKSYQELMDTIHKGDGSAIGHVENKKNSYWRYPSSYKADFESSGLEGAIKAQTDKIDAKWDRKRESLESLRYMYPQAVEKELKSLDRKRQKEKNDMYQVMSFLHHQKTGEHLEKIPVPTGKSEYYQRMKELDGRGKAYYASNSEMFARVFESYIQHKLQKADRKNQYLVHGTTEASVHALGAPFPIGKDRELMFHKMEKLLHAIKEEKAIQKALNIIQLPWY